MGSEMKQNIVLFPFMAQGHIIPFLALALKLEKQGFAITFINTPFNIKNLKQNISLPLSIQLLEIPFDSTHHGLPPNSETTETLPQPLMVKLFNASLSLEPGFTKIISDLINDKKYGMNTTPICIISDMFFAWSTRVAHKFGLYHAIFNAGGGFGMALLHTVWSNLPHLKVKSEEFKIPNFPEGYKFKVKDLPPHLQRTSGPNEFMQTLFQDWSNTDAMLFNSVEEIDSIGLTYFRQQFSCRIWAIGPIVSPTGSKARAGDEAQPTREICMKWLDSKPESSVLYVAFGSQSSPSVTQIKQLATALETSGVHFLWIVRPPSSFVTDHSQEDDWLPKGFEERIKVSEKGLILQKWVPQMEILSHRSVGAFLSHCGWNSTIEALSNGVPMLSWPINAEQSFNAKMLEEELEVCISIANGDTCDVNYEEISKKFKIVMNETKGKELRFKTSQVKEIMKNANHDQNCDKGSSVRALDKFLDAAIQMSNKLTKH